MDADDIGYHSSDNNEGNQSDELGEEGNTIGLLQDLNYNGSEEVALEEPDFDDIREQRFKRNHDVMKSLNTHIASTIFQADDEELNPRTAEECAAVVIQKHVRGFLAQRRYVELLFAKFEQEETLRREKTMEHMEEAELLLENHKLEVQFEEYNVARKNKAKRLVCYVITIQRAWRKFLATKRRHEILMKHDELCDIVAMQLSEAAIQSALADLL